MLRVNLITLALTPPSYCTVIVNALTLRDQVIQRRIQHPTITSIDTAITATRCDVGETLLSTP